MLKQNLAKQRFCRGDKFKYRFEKRINHGEWLCQADLKRTRGTYTEWDNKYWKEALYIPVNLKDKEDLKSGLPKCVGLLFSIYRLTLGGFL